MAKHQTVHFENADGVRTATLQLILEPKLGTLPLFYRMIYHQPTARILASREKWDQWKRTPGAEKQFQFLKKSMFVYQPGAVKNPALDYKIRQILQLGDDGE